MALPRVANDNANEVIVKQTDLLQSVSNSITKLSKDFTSFFSFEKERAKAQDSLRKSQAQKRAEDELEDVDKSKSMWNIDKLIDTISNLKLNLDGIGKAFTAKSGGIGGMIGNALIAGVAAYFVSDEFKAFVDDSFKSVGKYMNSEDFKKLVDDSVKTLLEKIDWSTAFSFLFGWRGLLVNAISKLAAEKLGEWADDAANWIIGLANKGLKHFGIKIDEVDIESLKTYYQNAKALIISSKKEGGPRVALEALASGIPVISTPVGHMADILPKELISDSSSFEDIKTMLDRNIKTIDQFKYDSIYEYVRNEYSLKNKCREINLVYESLLNDS